MASPTDHSTLINSLAATTTIMETFAKSLQTKDEQVDALPKGVQDKDAQIEALVQANQAKDVQLDALIKAIQAKEHKADFGGMRDQILGQCMHSSIASSTVTDESSQRLRSMADGQAFRHSE